MPTIRQKIIELLEEDARDARELSQTLRVPEKQLYNHLAHVAKSMNAKKRSWKSSRSPASPAAMYSRTGAGSPARAAARNAGIPAWNTRFIGFDRFYYSDFQ